MKKKLCIFSFIFVVIDQVIKFLITKNIELGKENYIIDKVLYITHVHNDGAAFSMFSGNQIFLIIITIISLLAVYFFFVKDKVLNKLELVLTSMLIGGIIGNFIDRIIHNYVIDYIGVIIFKYYFPIFNFADICIVLSIIGMVLLGLREDLCKNSKLKKMKEE